MGNENLVIGIIVFVAVLLMLNMCSGNFTPSHTRVVQAFHVRLVAQ